MSDTQKMLWTDWRGKEQTRTVNQVIDVRNFLGTPGYSLLLVAANTQLSVADLERWLTMMDDDVMPGVERSPNWIQKRRWMFQQPGTKNSKAARPDPDGKQAKAYAIMRANPTLSLYKLRALLSDHGITRSQEWIRRHRVLARL